MRTWNQSGPGFWVQVEVLVTFRLVLAPTDQVEVVANGQHVALGVGATSAFAESDRPLIVIDR